MHLTGREKILLHLLGAAREAGDSQWVKPASLSQAGISEGTDIPRKHIPRNLKVLLEQGLIDEGKSDVKGARQRRKVYTLTDEGRIVARELQERVANIEVRLRTDSETETMTLGEARRALAQQDREAAKAGLLFYLRSLGTTEVDDGGPPILDEARIMDELGGQTRVVKHISGAPLVPHFFGREQEQAAIEALVEEKRMVVVYGITGIGKSALASRLVGAHEGSVFWHTFHEWDTRPNLLEPLASFMGALGPGRPKIYEPGRDVNEVVMLLREGFAGSEALIVLDDVQKASAEFEKLLAGLMTSLEQMEGVTFLVLSRQIPGFYSRRDVAVKGTVAEYLLEGLDRRSSAELLTARGISEGEFDTLFERTHGHPLSLELVDTSDSHLDIANLEVYFEEELFRRLPAVEKQILQMAAIYRYPVSADGLLLDEDFDYTNLAWLVRHALLLQTAESGYYTHDFMRQNMLMRLAPLRRKRLHQRAAKFCQGSRSGRSDIETIFHHLSAGDEANAARVLLVRGHELISRGYGHELHDHLAELDLSELSESERVEALVIHGEIDIVTGDWQGAEHHLREALEIYQRCRDRAGMAKVFTSLGGLALRRHDSDAAIHYYEESRPLCAAIGDRAGLAHILNGLGVLHWQRGHIDRAREELQRSLALAEELDDRQAIARAVTNLGIIAFDNEELDEAIACYDRALTISKERHDRQTLAQIYDNLGEAYRLKGDRERALDYFDLGIELAEAHGFRLITAHLYRDMCALLEGDEKEYFQAQAQQIFTELGIKGED